MSGQTIGYARVPILVVILLLLAGCGLRPIRSDPWIVTQTHTYPAHSRTTYSGQCPAGLANNEPVPTNCTRNQVDYPSLMEVCATKRGVDACWYIPSHEDWAYFEQRPGREVQDFEDYIFTNRHPRPTNEWDSPR